MKHYHIMQKGFNYPLSVYATSKKQAIANYRKQYKLEGKRIGLTCYLANK